MWFTLTWNYKGWKTLLKKNFKDIYFFILNWDSLFLIKIHSMQGWTATARHIVTRKSST